jgi:FdhD protein
MTAFQIIRTYPCENAHPIIQACRHHCRSSAGPPKEIVSVTVPMRFRTQTAAITPTVDDGDHFSTIETSAVRFTGLQTSSTVENLTVEEPLEIQLIYGPQRERKTKSISVTMRTPGHDFELAAGFLLTEGVIRDVEDISDMRYVAGKSTADIDRPAQDSIAPYRPYRNTIAVELDPRISVSLTSLERNFYTTSSCGICGKASLLAIRSVCPPRVANEFAIDPVLLYRFPERLRSAQSVFDRTGGLHAAALFDAEGSLLSVREDVGRHNAVDKLIGGALLADRIPLRDRLLMLSGRASFELLQKAVMAGIPMVASVGAPSSLAVQVAREFDITLVGFLRESHFNVYHGAGRLSGYSRETIEVHP